jgi:hypothetical protein
MGKRKLLDFVIDRLDERSTWVWITTTGISILGATLEPEMREAIIGAGMAIGVLAGTLLPDGKVKAEKDF